MASREQVTRAVLEFQTRGEAKAEAALDAVADAQRKVAAAGEAMVRIDDQVVRRSL